jgi:arabinose-5-phosphate isomerase
MPLRPASWRNGVLKKEDFASFHPGGSLGKRLFVKALDLARRDDLPMLDMDAAIKDAIAVMTDGKLGTVLLMDGRKVKALLSDGDLPVHSWTRSSTLTNRLWSMRPKTPKVK